MAMNLFDLRGPNFLLPENASNHKLASALKWIIGLLGAVVISPLVFMAVKGLLGFGICVLLYMIGYKFFPAVSLYLSNLALKAFRLAAAANPVETLQNILIVKMQEYDDQNAALTRFDSKVRNFDDKKDRLARRFPTEVRKFEEMSRNMHAFLEDWRTKQRHAIVTLQHTKAELEKAQAIWEVACAGQEVASLSKKAKARIYQQIAEQVAVDAITGKLNQAFASLDQMSRQQNIEFSSMPHSQFGAGPPQNLDAVTSYDNH
jgi:methyl-accepting chemotaxis protein